MFQGIATYPSPRYPSKIIPYLAPPNKGYPTEGKADVSRETCPLFADAKARKNVPQQVIRREFSSDGAEANLGQAQFLCHELRLGRGRLRLAYVPPCVGQR